MLNLDTPEQLAQSLRDSGSRLVINISHGVFGHVVSEFDNYMRQRLCEGDETRRPCVLLAPPDRMTSAALEFFGDSFEAVSTDLHHKLMGDCVANLYPELTLDVGLSSYKVAPPSRGYRFMEMVNGQLSYRTGYLNGAFLENIRYYRRLEATEHLHPMRLNVDCPLPLREFVSPHGKPVALLHQRQAVSAGNKVEARGSLYQPAIEYLIDKGYSPVFVGREIFPEEWKKYNVVDYANSVHATVRNDFHLFRLAALAILGASGTNMLAETQGIPYLQVNTTLFATPPFAKNAISLPALWSFAGDQEGVSAALNFMLNFFRGVQAPANMHAISVTGQDVLEAVRELENLMEKDVQRSSLQERWIQEGLDVWKGETLWEGKTLWENLPPEPWVGGNDELLNGQNEDGMLAIANSRVAQGFLERNAERLFG